MQPAFDSDGATVPVAAVSSRTEADLIVGLLRNNGLRAAVSADDAGGQEPQLQAQGVRVLVAPSDEAPARRLLAAVDDTPVDDTPVDDTPSKPASPTSWRRWIRRLLGTSRG